MSDGLDRLKRKLYGQSRELGARAKKDTLSELRSDSAPDNYKTSWRETKRPQRRNQISLMAKLIIGLAVVVVGIVAGAVIYLFGGFGAISSGQIEFEISAPENISGGDKVIWHVTLKNNNEVPLEHAEIAFEYPEGSKPLNENIRSKYLIERRSIGIVGAGEYVDEVFEAFVFGEEDGVYRASAVLEYRTQGSNAILAKEISSEIKVLKSPIGVFVNIPESINIGQEVEIEVVYLSNSPKSIDGLTLSVEYPDGFEFVSAYPSPSLSTHTWDLPELSAKEEKRISIRGKLSGENLENKVFKATVGMQDNGLLAVYGAGSAGTILRRPFLDISILVNGQSEYVASPGEAVAVSVIWKNNLPVSVKNAVLEMKLDGTAFDYGSMSVQNGSYRGSDRTIIWNPSFYPTFSFLQPMQEGELKFRTKILKNIPIENFGDINFKVGMDANMYLGERPEGFEGVDIDGNANYEIKITSDLQLSRQGYFYSSIIPNAGPLPPKVGSETTYTMVWSLINSSNNLENVKVYAVLPSYINWKNRVSPVGEGISYDPISGRVEWNVGDLSAGVGILRPAREAAFQIGFIPSVNQAGSAPILISEVTAEAKDTFTGAEIKQEAGSLTTRLFTDPQMNYKHYDVVE